MGWGEIKEKKKNLETHILESKEHDPMIKWYLKMQCTAELIQKIQNNIWFGHLHANV